MRTFRNLDLHDKLVVNYLGSLVGQFYKILPIKESGEITLNKYIESLQRELIGCSELIKKIHYDEQFASLIFILEYLLAVDCEVSVVKSEVFKAINICKKLQSKYLNSKEVSACEQLDTI